MRQKLIIWLLTFLTTFVGLFVGLSIPKTASYISFSYPIVRQVFNWNKVPTRLTIPKLDVDAVVESVGKDAEGKMDVPKNVDNVGWYNLGTYPGEPGNMVIDGHLDSETDAAVFYDLSKLEQGDVVIVEDRGGKKYRYEVTSKRQYNDANFPLKTVFGPTDIPQLNLITCGGTWDEQKKEYLQRTVIYSTLQE